MSITDEKLSLSLGDIIKVISPDNDSYDKKIYYIEYLDNEDIRLVNEYEIVNLKIEDGKLLNNYLITEVNIIEKSKTNSYAKLNDLLKDTMIELKINNDDKSLIIRGKIIDVIEDMIEIKNDKGDIIYIDFEYKGIPKYLDIEYINILEYEDREDVEYMDDETDLGAIRIDANKETINKRYPIREQKDDMVIKFLENKDSISTIEKQIERYEELRNKYSLLDNNNIPIGLILNEDKKPLIEGLKNGVNKENIITIGMVARKLDNEELDILGDDNDYYFNEHNKRYDDEILRDYIEQERLYNENLLYTEHNIIYKNYLNYINHTSKPYKNIKEKEGTLMDIEAINNTLISFLKVKDHYLQNNYTSGIKNYLYDKENDENIERFVFDNERLNLKGIVTMPYDISILSKIYGKQSNILEKVNLSRNNILKSFILKKTKRIKIKYINASSISNDDYFNKIIEYKKDSVLNYDDYLNNIIPHRNFIIRNVIRRITSNNILTVNNLINILECYDIFKDDLSVDDNDVIYNELLEGNNEYITKYKKNVKDLKSIINKLVDLKNDRIVRMCSFDYLNNNNDNDENINNRVNFFIKYLKYKIFLNSNNNTIIELIDRINKNINTNNLVTNIIELKNIFDSKINYNDINRYIKDIDQEEVDIEEITKSMVGEYEKNIVIKLEYTERLFEFDKLCELKASMNKRQMNNRVLMLVSDIILEDIKKSPYEEMRDEIIMNKNKHERSNEILMFIHKYCRKPSMSEIDIDKNYKYWYICNETNVKLIPKFYYDIAISIVERPYDTEYHTNIIEKLCSLQGTVELGRTIDIHSGFTIKEGEFKNTFDMDITSEEIDYEDEGGYEAVGQVDVLDSVLSDYMEEEVEEDGDENEKEEENEEEDYYDYYVEDSNISSTDLKDFDEFNADIYCNKILKKVLNILNIRINDEDIKKIISKSLYIFNIDNNDRLFKLNNTNDSVMILHYKSFLVLYTMSMLFLYIQMCKDLSKIYLNDNNNIDLNKLQKGWPIYDDDSYVSIELFTELLKKNEKEIRDKGFETCLQLKREEEDEIDYFTKNMIKCIRKNILKNNRLMYEIKDFKNELNNAELQRNNIRNKNVLMLPPLIRVPYNISKENFENIGDDFKDKLKKGNNVLDRLTIINSKDIYYTYLLIERINLEVKNKELIFNNYIENSCCKSDKGLNILEYLDDYKIKEYERFTKLNNDVIDYVMNIRSKDSIYNNTDLKGNYLNDETMYEYSREIMDHIDKIIDPNNNQLVERNDFADKLRIYYESKMFKKLDFNNYVDDEIIWEDKNEIINDETDEKIKDLYLNLENDKENKFEKAIYSVNDRLSKKCLKYFKLTDRESIFLNPLFDNNKVINMKNHIRNYMYVSLNEKINSKNILKNDNKTVKDLLILNCWNLSDNSKSELNNILINTLNYKEYDNFYDNDLKEVLYKVRDYYMNNKMKIEGLYDKNGLGEKYVLLYLKYLYLRMIDKMIYDDISGEDEKKLIKLIKGYANHYVESLKLIDVEVKRVKNDVIIQVEDEKDKVTDNYKKMTQEKRDVEMELRKNKLGKYGVSKKKGFFKYSKKFEDVNY